MKKGYLVLTLTIVCTFVASAQETSIQTFKPTNGDKTLEVQFTPFGSNVISINGIRGRKFKTESKALRLNAFVGYTSNSVITQQANSDFDRPELKDKNNALTVNIRPGIEKHLKGTDRLSPYYGGELDLAIQNTVSKSEVEINNKVEIEKEINTNGFARFGINAIAGFDYYIAKHLYLGTEIGFGFSYKKDLSIKQKSSVSGYQEPDPFKRGGTFNLGPNVNATIRLGYIFSK